MNRSYQILWIGGNSTGRERIEKTLNDAKFPHRLIAISDLPSAIELLEDRRDLAAGKIDLILVGLDPNGSEDTGIPTRIKENPALAAIPLVLTTSGFEATSRSDRGEANSRTLVKLRDLILTLGATHRATGD